MSTTAESPALELVVPEIDETLKLAPIAPASQLTLRQVFTPHFVAFKALAEEAKLIAVNAPRAARDMRLKLRAVRVAAEKTRVAAGEEAKRYKTTVDTVYKVLETNLSPIETRMQEIEDAEVIAEAARKEALRVARVAELGAFVAPESLVFYDLANMPTVSYTQLVQSSRLAKEAQIAAAAKAEADRLEAIKVAEDKRKAQEAADAAERQRLAAENARLAEVARKEREAREAAEKEAARKAKEVADQAAREKAARDAADKAAEAIRVNNERVAANQRAAEQAAKDAEAAKQKAAADLVAKQEREKREAAEKALADQQKATADKVAADQAAAKRAAAAPDKAKLAALAAAIRLIEVPNLTAIPLQATIIEQRQKFAAWVDREAAKL